MFLQYFEKLSKNKTPMSIEQRPIVSIIVPVYNERLYIDKILKSIFRQDYPINLLDVIFVDGMSTDGTREILFKYRHRNPYFRIVDNHCKIVPSGLNKAMEHVKGEIIARVDGHSEITSDYISRCVQYLNEFDVGGVGGKIQSVGDTIVSQAIAIGMSSRFGVGGSSFRVMDRNTGYFFTDTIVFPCYKREVFDKAGLYDEEFLCNEDDEFNYRLREEGFNLLIATDICTKYFVRGSLNKLFYQYYRYGKWKVRVLQKHPRQMRLRQFVPPIFVAALLVSVVPSIIWPPGLYIFALVLGSYLVTNLAASFWTASRRGWRYLFLLPVVYAILHFSYGFGFLVGLIKFVNRWKDKEGLVPKFESKKFFNS